jgi:hypothetical protein
MSIRLISIISIFGFAVAAWLVYLFFESDSCMDAGGSFEYLRFRCNTGSDLSYTFLYRSAKPAFWVIYGICTLLAGIFITGILGGVIAGVRSLWSDVLRGTGRA